MRLRLPIFLVVFLFLFCLFPSKSRASGNKHGGQLVFATTSDPRSFNPVLAKETSTTTITGLIFEGLTRTNGETLEVEPNLAKEWKVSEDGLTWIFYLRNDVVWSDGNQFSADDVIFTFNQLIFNLEIPNSSRDIFTVEGKVFKVEKIDRFTVKFILPLKFAPFLRSMSQSILPKHILEESVNNKQFNFTWGTDARPEDIIGTGPFQLDKYLPGQRIVLKRNPMYWRKDKEGNSLPYLEGIIFLVVLNQDTALLKFQEGELDYFGLSGSHYPLLKPEEKKGNFTIYEVGPAFGSNFLVFNQNAGVNPKTNEPFVDPVKMSWFKNLKFRQAIAHAIDKRGIIEIIMNDLGFPQDCAMSPSAGFFYNPDVQRYEYDKNVARSILEKEGFIDRDNDGIIEDKNGNKVEFSLFTNSGNTDRVQIASIIRKDLEDIGMEVKFLQLEFNNLVRKLTSTFKWDVIVVGLTGGIEPHFGKNVWHSSGHLHMWYPMQESPKTNWEIRIDEIFDQAVQELNRKRRKRLYDEWQEIVSKELPVIYTVLPATIFAVRNKFGNLRPTSYGGAFHNLEEIYIKQK